MMKLKQKKILTDKIKQINENKNMQYVLIKTQQITGMYQDSIMMDTQLSNKKLSN